MRCSNLPTLVRHLAFDRSRPIRIVTSRDLRRHRPEIADALSRNRRFRLIGDAPDSRSALQEAVELQADAVVLYHARPRLAQLESLWSMSRDHRSVRVLVILDWGRRGDSIWSVSAPCGSSGTYRLLDAAIRSAALRERPGPSRAQVGRLSPRQHQVLEQICDGRGTKEIAFGLGVSVKTVETHRQNLMEKVGIRTVAGLVRYAIRTGLVRP